MDLILVSPYRYQTSVTGTASPLTGVPLPSGTRDRAGMLVAASLPTWLVVLSSPHELIDLSQTLISISELRASAQPLTYAQRQLLERFRSFHAFRDRGR